jgi:FKBP-type peptidyl-prolyl cis-trans isomerase SlyD
MSKTAAPPRVVTFHYTLRDGAGRVIDTSAGGEPITYLEGGGQIIDGLDQRLRSASSGARLTVQVPAAEAYGAHDPAQVQSVKRSRLPVDGELQVGDQFQAGSDRHAPVVKVVAIDGDDVTLDANHPMAGVDLVFDVEVVTARPATPTEISHGHPHPDDGTGHCQ